jgi:transglutaminase-like putative cysteine protease
MRLAIRHLTRYTYPNPIAETHMELRLQPAERAGQHVVSFDLRVLPASPARRYVDAFGNVVHAFNHVPAHDLVEIASLGVVDTGLGEPALEDDETPEDFLNFRPPVLDVPAVRRLAGRHRVERPDSTRSVERTLDELTRDIGQHVSYRPESTTVFSAVDEVLRQRTGVCQDFAHLFIAAARALRIPARYVSGYVYTGDGGPVVGASHAWAEAWVPRRGWVGYDATHPVRTGDRHVRVAVGRDYRDAAPTRGVYVGAARGVMEVEVEVQPAPAPP